METLFAAKCDCCNIVRADTCNVRLCPRAGAQVVQQQPLIYTLLHFLKDLSIANSMKEGESFSAHRGIQIVVVIC